jgi:hypothetical protein
MVIEDVRAGLVAVLEDAELAYTRVVLFIDQRYFLVEDGVVRRNVCLD